jgi:SAM-dependent methyltransferase
LSAPSPIDDDLLLRAIGREELTTAGVDLTIDADDEMLRVLYERAGRDLQRARLMYYESGISLWLTLRRVVEWRYGEAGRVAKLLDFASGHGRVTRFLVRDVAPGRVWVSDISPAAVEFQRRQFGVHAFASSPRPEELACDERFDCILVSSLFTHLPEATFLPWLRRLWELLLPGGLLAFSVHDASVLPRDRQLPAGGLLFEASSESASLAGAEYGSTWVSEGFVREALRAVAPDSSALRIPKALANYQDLYVVVAEPRADFSRLLLAGGIEAFVEYSDWTPPDRLDIQGWVADRVSGRLPVEVRGLIDGEVLARCSAFSPRPDVSGLFPVERVEAAAWRLELRLPGSPPDLSAQLRIEAVDADGRAAVIFEGSVQGAMLRSCRLQLFITHEARRQLEAELPRTVAGYEESLATLRQETGARVGNLEARIGAMEASFFWRLRDRWFALKRFLRLTDER